MKTQRRLMLLGILAVVVPLLWTGNAGAAGLNYTVALTWGTTTPPCVAPIVCSGVGTADLSSGKPASDLDQPTTLSLQALSVINQPGADPVPVGVLTYCNGVTEDPSEITSVKLLADFDLPGVGTGQAEDVTTLVIRQNGDDPQASADSLFLASNPGKSFTVLESSCAKIQLLGRITIEPAFQVSLGPTIGEPTTPTTATTTSTVPTSTGPTTTTTTVPNRLLCPLAYAPKCAPELRDDWNCPGEAVNPLPDDWYNLKIDGSLPSELQDPWGLDGPIGPAIEGIGNVACEGTAPTTTTIKVSTTGSVTTTTARVQGASTTRSSSSGSGSSTGSGSASGTSASGLAATGLGGAGPLAIMAVGLLMIGVAATRSQFGRKWYATQTPGVRYTIDRVQRKK